MDRPAGICPYPGEFIANSSDGKSAPLIRSQICPLPLAVTEVPSGALVASTEIYHAGGIFCFTEDILDNYYILPGYCCGSFCNAATNFKIARNILPNR